MSIEGKLDGTTSICGDKAPSAKDTRLHLYGLPYDIILIGFQTSNTTSSLKKQATIYYAGSTLHDTKIWPAQLKYAITLISSINQKKKGRNWG